MTPRWQIPVYSPIGPGALAGALRPAWTRAPAAHAHAAAALAERFGARRVLLTDSGTSALIIAFRATVGEGGTVALPAYVCVDLAAAARYARVRVRLYDVDPGTLGADLDSLRDALKRGAQAAVVAHLYGFPVDVPRVAALAAEHGAAVIEDAAQGAGGTLHGIRLGAFGPLSVLSFGRGKGLTGGGGGALLATNAEWASRLADAEARLGDIRAGWRNLLLAAGQWALARPAVYGLPASVPGLHLGETVYRPAHEPAGLTAAAASLLDAALATADSELTARRRTAAALTEAAAQAEAVRVPRALAGGAPGFLRLPVLVAADRKPAPRLGVLRGYPRTLLEEPEMQPCLHPREPPQPGATELRRSLFTLPTHSRLRERDLADLRRWLLGAGGGR